MQTLSAFFGLCRPFWGGRQAWRNWLLLAAVITFALLIIRVSVWITEWNKTFYDALAQFDGEMIPSLVGQYLGYIALVVLFVVCGNYLRKVLILRWREHLTHEFERLWLGDARHYLLQVAKSGIDNPDQRIAEDCYLLADKSVDLCKYFLMNIAKLGAFITVLWQMSGVQSFELFGVQVTVHGYLVWVALSYSLICTLMTHIIGHKLQPLNIDRQHKEADYRAALLRIHDNSEAVALYHAKDAEMDRLATRFMSIKDNWYALIKRELKLETFSASYLRLSMFIPIIATLPMYLARTMTFGDMMQARSAFGNVQDGFGWFMDYYKRIMEWAAVVARLEQFHLAMTELTPVPPPATNESVILSAKLTLHTPQGITLLENVELCQKTPTWLLLDGKSGIGKSTLIKVLARIWPYYQGKFTLVARKALFLPQRPYLPEDSLRRSVAYPFGDLPDDERLLELLTQVGLSDVVTDFDAPIEWHKVLSGGQQQRLSMIRALYHRPDVLFLDEATNQLDDASAVRLLRTLKDELPHVLCLGISHQALVKELFDTRLDLQKYQNYPLKDDKNLL